MRLLLLLLGSSACGGRLSAAAEEEEEEEDCFTASVGRLSIGEADEKVSVSNDVVWVDTFAVCVFGPAG